MEPKTKNQSGIKTQQSAGFEPDYRIAILSAIGLLGLIAGFVILAYHDLLDWHVDGSSESNFHEIAYHPREIVRDAMFTLGDSVNNKIGKDKDSLEKLNKQLIKFKTNAAKNIIAAEASDKIKKQLIIDSSNDEVLKGYSKYYSDANPSDSLAFSTLNKALHFQISLDTLRKWDKQFDSIGYGWEGKAGYSLKITDTKPGINYNGKTIFSIDRPVSDTAFGIKYPAAGTWILFILIFCSYCFITVSTCVYINQQVVDFFETKKIKRPERKYYYLTWLITFFALCLILKIWRMTFNDELMIKQILFMKNFNQSMFFVIGIGYAAGAACLAGFIYTASMLGYFAKQVKLINVDIESKKDQIASMVNDSEAKTANTEMQKLKDDQNNAYEIFQKLLGFFNRYFVLAAVIMSLMVLCTGAIFTAINSLEFVKLLSSNWGYSLVSPDYIYLYGGLHTVILLLVYLPAKMRFSEIQVIAPKTDPASNGTVSQPAEGQSKWFDLLKTPFGQLKDILLAASPLLASLVQALFSTLFK